jgi:hypothetical protein
VPTKKNAPTPAEQTDQGLADAVGVRAERAHKLSECQDALALLLDRRRNGDDTVTPTQVRDARDEVEHWTELLAAADREVERATAAQINTDTTLAEALAGPLGKALGVEVTATCTDPSDVPKALPTVLLVQRRPADCNLRTGEVTGSAELVHFGVQHRHSAPTMEGVRGALLSAGIRVRVSPGGGLRHGQDVREVRLCIDRLSGAFPRVPTLAYAPSPDDLRHARWVVADAIEAAHELVASPFAGLPMSASQQLLTNGPDRLSVLVKTDDPRLVSDTTGEDGQRLMTVEVQVKVTPKSWATTVTESSIYERRHEFAAAMVDIPARALGRCISAAVTATASPEKGAGVFLTYQITFASRLPDGQSSPLDTVIPSQPSQPKAGRGTAGTPVDIHGRSIGSHPGGMTAVR